MQPNLSGIRLRAATLDDAALLGRLHAASWQATYRGLMPSSYLDNEAPAERDQFWHTRMAQPFDHKRSVQIAELQDAPVGFVCMQARADPEWGALLDNLHALPQHQGIGAGRIMIRAAEDWARGWGDTRIHLFVFEQNLGARAFYERQGWRSVDRSTHELAGHAVTALRYVKTLDGG
jgi:GNAT superfamily N-acetyltransferase